ncbi:DNA gyrase inhibitor YacG [Pseudoroseomonas wenyumeiae]|uniref:DNA gyrase inhibitor YacG n=1 Tax=Teichococcus wenyumeiae TaxID=2478470 RepID=A0A3A9J5R4_9PROT|nr:DNA gyrase inhibitor YacG [Pseudoroseomonas wenyumeiae]RKK01792.1 DNA gyrase inhibitor YacG [Pseudoroseomonas wenyumeiae]RMI20404.1 DNA gyrase inhibitor YacG [Pseudoroseomonas wenyumeiae]
MPSKPTTACPICGKAATPEHRPFCSARCRQVDLGRWLSGSYVIPGAPVEPEEDEAEN